MTSTKWITALALATITATAVLPGIASAQRMGGQERPSFETLDLDGNGSITVAEFQAQSATRFAEADANGDGMLSVDEITAAAVERASARSAAMATRMIEWRDTDGDGMLSQAELGNGRDGERAFSHMDADDDGVISAEEFAEAQEMGPRGNHRKGDRKGGEHRRG